MKSGTALLCVWMISSSVLHANELQVIEITLVDRDAISYGTFQSHNQKVVQNKRGIFMTHVRSRNEKYTAQQWRLSWSRDGGKSFSTIHEATEPTNSPVLETDSRDTVYLARPNFVNRNAYVARFLASEDYRTAHETVIPNASAGKFAMMLDEPRKQLYFALHNGVFNRITLDGAPLTKVRLNKPGENATMVYPLLSLGADGVLHAAWTSLNVPLHRYWGIHHLQSSDGGVTWTNFKKESLSLPVIADETGPSDRITLNDEFEPSTWLSSFLVKGGKAHFHYMARTKPLRQHHLRYDIATGQREIDHQPEFRGETIALHGPAGFFATRKNETDSPLFCVGKDKHQPRLACLRSNDNGATWHDHAISEPIRQPYAIGGFREITPDGWIIGSFTDITGEEGNGGVGGRVYFFRIRAE